MYYEIKNRTDSEVGNVYPQISFLNDSIHDVHKFNSNFNPDKIGELKADLNNRSILTDILSEVAFSSTGFVLNAKVKNIFSNYNLINHTYYPIFLTKDTKIFNYYRLHIFNEDFNDNINYSESKFNVTHYGFKEDTMNLQSIDDYINFKTKYKTTKDIESEFIYLSSKMKEYDMFTIYPYDNNIYISEKLKKDLEKNNITGVEFKEATKINL